MTDIRIDDPAAPSPPVPPPAAPGHRPPIDRRALRLALLALLAGAALEVGLRGGPANGVVVAGLFLAIIALVLDDQDRRSKARWLALAALAPTGFLAVRASPWLAASNLTATAGLVTLAVTLSRSGSLLDTTPLRLVVRSADAARRAALGPAALRPLAPRWTSATWDRARRLGVALLVALPLLFAVAALLASADAVFAGLLSPDVDLGPVTGHVVLTLVLAAGVVGMVAATRGDTDDDLPHGWFGTVEVATMLGLATVVTGLFALSQLVAVTDAGDRLVEAAGLTPAEYARSGFFQLCWATALILAFLGLVRGLAAPHVLDRPGMRALSGTVPLLSLALVVVSLRRMALYDEAFGLTMLRLWVIGAAIWMGLVLLMVAARNLGLAAGRDWVVGGAVVAALALVLVANIANPEAFLVRHNVDRAADGAELDAAYLQGLSDDAVPDYIAAQRDAPPGVQAQLAPGPSCDHATGVKALNLAVARAADNRPSCPSRRSFHRYQG
jgi:hypothetical protein